MILEPYIYSNKPHLFINTFIIGLAFCIWFLDYHDISIIAESLLSFHERKKKNTWT